MPTPDQSLQQPIACSLSASEYAARMQEIAALVSRALLSRVQIRDGVRLTFEPGMDIEGQLREIIAAEARCCPFLRFEIRPGADVLLLDITGPEEAAPINHEAFASAMSEAPSK